MCFLLTITLVWIVCCNAAPNVSEGYENVALGGQATQSSIYYDKNTSGPTGQASNAVDGNMDATYDHGSCSHTHYDFSPWWRVDLLRVHKIHHIIITNRESAGSRLNGSEIRIGNSLQNNGNNNPRCASISSIPDGASQTFQCNNMVGRYVNILIQGRNEFLQLCEVQVFGVPVNYGYENVALGARATQSSIYYDENFGYIGQASNAVDGNLDTNYDHRSCSHTYYDFSPWWRVDLLRVHTIHHINITNREYAGSRLNGAEIRIGNSLENNGNNNPRCAIISSIPDGASRTFQCSNMEGRYVNVVILGRSEYLHLCEVQVFGLPVNSGYENVALGGRATQSSIYYNENTIGSIGTASNAVDGNLDTNYFHGSCSHTYYEFSPWWRVDLLRPHKIHHIIITNRDFLGFRLNGAEICIGNSLENNGNNNPRCAIISSIPDGASQTFQCNNMEGRYVNIVILGRNEFLQFCEVQIFGVPVKSAVPIPAEENHTDDAV